MKVLNLRCASGHVFEGWFGSEADYQQQFSHGQLICPLCDTRQIERLPSAPRLNLSGAKAEALPAADSGTAHANAVSVAPGGHLAEPATALLQDAWVAAVKAVLKHTEDVGSSFAEEVRRIHYGEAEARGIRGVTTDTEREALSDEGIEVHTLPVPASLKGRSH